MPYFKSKSKRWIRFNISSELGALASFAGLNSKNLTSNSDTLLERVVGREFILKVKEPLGFEDDPYFNSYVPNEKTPDLGEPAWKAAIKRILGWQKSQAKKCNRREQYSQQLPKQHYFETTESGAIIIFTCQP